MKCLHTTSEDPNQCYALDYRPDGLKFATAGQDYQVNGHHVCVCARARACVCARARVCVCVCACVYVCEHARVLVCGVARFLEATVRHN
jgi:hypothetical protein